MLAAKKNQGDVVRFLIDHEGSMQDHEGKCAMIYAIEGNAADAVEELVEVEYNVFDTRQSHAFHYAAKLGRTEIMVCYYDTYQSVVNEDGESALMWAASADQVQMVNFLLNDEHDFTDSSGKTALHWAAQGDGANAARPLLKKLLNKLDNNGVPALYVAMASGSHKIAPLLLSEQKIIKEGEPFIVQAVRQNKHKILKVMSDVVRFGYSELAKGVDYTPAEISACKQALAYVQKSDGGKFPKGADLLQIAVISNASESVRVLSQYLKDYVQVDGTTALMLAGMKDTGLTEAALKALAEAQAGKKLKKDGNTALLLACYQQCKNIAFVNAVKGYEAELADKSGRRPIEVAKLNKRADIVAALVAAE